MINPDEFNQLFANIVKPKKPVDINYRLYYNKETGKPLQFTIDEQIGAVNNVMIVDRDSSTKWKIKTHDAE